MKTLKVLSALAALFILFPAFVSCDKDKDKDEPAGSTAADYVAGTYSGDMTCDVAAMGQTWTDLTIDGVKEVKIIKDDKASGRVTVVLPECSYTIPPTQTLQTIPSLTVENVKVEELGKGLHTLEAKEYAVAVGDVQYTVTIHKHEANAEAGTVILLGQELDLMYSVTPGKMPGSITFDFSGMKK